MEPTRVEGRSLIKIADQPLEFGLVTHPEPAFEQGARTEYSVWLRIDAFSCNYRDKSLLLTFAKVGRPDSFVCFGSEFVGEVMEVGSKVTRFRPGDRVIADGTYPFSGVEGLKAGLPTNFASKRLLAIHEAKLIKIPSEMPDEVAASFQIGAQTTYSMIRKLDLAAGSRVLVTAGSSNTSIFALHALSTAGMESYILSSSPRDQASWPPHAERFVLAKGSSLRDHQELVSLCRQLGGFDAVIDPFYDIYAAQVIPFLKPGGKYVTCGCYRQAEEYARDESEGSTLPQVLGMAMINNNVLIGNCIGETGDLQRAISDYEAGRLQVTVDNVYRGTEVGPFLDRTYNDPDRFGKVVYSYR